jgi:type IV pilus assembly protein PilE
LIELMIVVVIVGILSAIALPSYNAYIQKGRRVDAQAALMELAQALERNFTLRNTYCTTGTGTSCVITLDTTVKARVQPYYTIADPSLLAGTASDTGYTLQAEPTAMQSGDSCGTLSLSSVGDRTARKNGVNVSGCWN